MLEKFIGSVLGTLIFCGTEASLLAQGTAFTYQGQLNVAGSPASGGFDLTFALYPSGNLASPSVAGPITNAAVTVSNGLFTTALDFGPGIFTGTNYWLGIGVRTNGAAGPFTPLSPRQPLTPAPYSVFANTASNLSGTLPSTQLSGALPSAQISGTYANAVTFTNGANHFLGAFTGDGSTLSNLNASQLTAGTVADARLTANVALLNANQTYVGLNTMTNEGNSFNGSFSGSFFGNGLVGWIPVAGTSQQAVRDTGYLLTSSGLATVTLPLNGALTNTDIVRVSGAGAGGWLVKENSGQVIFGSLASYHNSVLGALPISGDYRGVAVSADGVQMYAVGNAVTGVYVSTDSGQHWNPTTGVLSGYWYSIACSANGRIVYALPSNGGTIKKSTNSGATWSNSSSSASAGNFIACTADGDKVFTSNYACSGNGTYLAKLSGGSITISTNGGSSFNINVTEPTTGLTCLGASSDCTKLVTGKNGGLLYASANAGATWTALTTANGAWTSAWMSPDGSKIAATVGDSGSYAGGIFSDSVTVQPNTVSTNSTIGGSQGSAVELQYIGGGKFMPVSSSGTLWAN